MTTYNQYEIQKVQFLIKNRIKQLVIFIALSTITSLSFSQNIFFQGFNILSFTISHDGENMLIVSDHTGKSMMYESTLTGGTWSLPVSIDTLNNYSPTESFLSAPSFSYDKKYIYFSASFADGFGGKDIYYIARQEDNSWSKPLNLGSKINSFTDEDAPSLSPDNMTLYYVRKNLESELKKINCGIMYFSNRDVNSEWTKSARMPLQISTGCDCAPKILNDNKTIVFSKFDKKQGWDLYFIRKLDSKNWFLPELIAVVTINEDNNYPVYVEKTKQIYYLEQLKRPVIKTIATPAQALPAETFIVNGKISDKNTNKPLNARIDVYDPKTSKTIASNFSDSKTGNYQLILPPGQEYSFVYFSNGYSSEVKNFDAKILQTSEQVNHDVSLFDKVSVFVNIIDKDFFEPLDGEIKVTNQNNIVLDANVVTKIDKGLYKLTLKVHDTYKIETKATGYTPGIIFFDLHGEILFSEFEKDIELESEKVPFTFSLDDIKTGNNVECTVTLIDKKTGEKIEVTGNDKTGKYLVNIRKGTDYDIIVNSPQGYLFYSDKINSAQFAQDAQPEMAIHLQPIEQNLSVELANINFESNSADLFESSYDELDRVVKLLTDNLNIIIEISAHTDDLGSDDYNLRLSEQRAKSVIDYIVLKNIPTERLVALGLGESKPLVPNNSDENRALNRRVELKIVKISE